jgi:hypothetical protein
MGYNTNNAVIQGVAQPKAKLIQLLQKLSGVKKINLKSCNQWCKLIRSSIRVEIQSAQGPELFLIVDVGPHKNAPSRAIIDLTYGAAEKLGLTRNGNMKVKTEVTFRIVKLENFEEELKKTLSSKSNRERKEVKQRKLSESEGELDSMEENQSFLMKKNQNQRERINIQLKINQ